MSAESILTIIGSLLSGGTVAGLIALRQKRMELRAAAPKSAAESDSLGRAADGGTIDRLAKENERLSKRNGDLDAKITALELRADAADARADKAEAREDLLMEAMHRWQVWASQVTEIASRQDLVLPPPPRSPIQDAPTNPKD